MKTTILIIFAIMIAGTCKAQESTVNLNHNFTDNSWGQLDEEGVYPLKDGTIAVVETSLNGLKGRKALRKRALKNLKNYCMWNDIKVKQINEKFRGAHIGVGPKLTMIFKIIE